jgi:hypothetical protein
MAGRAADIVERFPEHELVIERLARISESFRSMCDDYAPGVEALRHWERTDDPKREARIAELRDSLAELEEEILRALDAKASYQPG